MSISPQNQGMIYVIATPIGNLGDISQRALVTLATVDLIAAEDTRHSKRLLDHYQIKTPIVSLHEHNEKDTSISLLQRIQLGESVALISDAGTPLISDPGFYLITIARQAGIKIVPIPGACAAIAALSASGLPSDRFIFEGFLPATVKQRQKRLRELQSEIRTLIFYEAPHRIMQTLSDIKEIFGSSQFVVLARELTKIYESIMSDTVENLVELLTRNQNQQKGEFVILVKGAEFTEDQKDTHTQIRHILKILLAELPLKQAVNLTSQITGSRKNEIYEIALTLKK